MNKLKEKIKENIFKIYVLQFFINIIAVFYILISKESRIMYAMFLGVLIIMAISFLIICWKGIVKGIVVNIHKHINF